MKRGMRRWLRSLLALSLKSEKESRRSEKRGVFFFSLPRRSLSLALYLSPPPPHTHTFPETKISSSKKTFPRAAFGPLFIQTLQLLYISAQDMNVPPPDGGAAVQAGATANTGRDGTTQCDDHSPATTTSTQQAPAAAPRATLKLRNDRGTVELSSDGFCKVRVAVLERVIMLKYGVGELVESHWRRRAKKSESGMWIYLVREFALQGCRNGHVPFDLDVDAIVCVNQRQNQEKRD